MEKTDNKAKIILKLYLHFGIYFCLFWLLGSFNSYSHIKEQGGKTDFTLLLVMWLLSPSLLILIFGAILATALHFVLAKIFMYTPRS